MRIDIWSDVVCPWCYIGKRRLEAALSTFEHAEDVEVVWHSFQLDPGAPTSPTESTSVMLARKYGQSPAGARQMQDQVTSVAAEDGLAFRLPETLHVNTLDAHRLIHLALDQGGPELQGVMKEALLSAYFIEARNVADHDVLREVATSAGLDSAAVDRMLASDEHANDVIADIEQARSLGANGVPFFVIDSAFGVSGAQPAEVFSQVLERAWQQSHPSLQLVGDGDACGPDGCAV
ncbi:MAG: Disulfide bond formation protein DsbA [Nocardioides sp.]|jgi:predicted DsbA family dithiol-disulfide isomerase|uniref:DsbA family oxidoreductase n=1 Tax=Nocardioides sp. TaxID=35761 RepID=UPI00262A0B2F|nr:DsbA family oxidoreductase [Nocardioides sp.]MCW2834055.1 Disulfide bond formation protein DsbA [Nocardioides sp.]